MIKQIDLRANRGTELGNIEIVTGDSSLGYFVTNWGYKLIIDGYNMKKIADLYTQKETKKD